MKYSRRKILGAGAIGSVGLAGKTAFGALCGGLTPPQTEGPFYPVDAQADTDWDLTHVKGRQGRAQGRVVYIYGTVTDQQCRPVEGAVVEIWQANAKGKYNHPGDPSPAPLDPNFQHWGRYLTGKAGRYTFRTIVPGQYPATNDWVRPAHVHFKILKRGMKTLTTQMYFKGDPYNRSDRILMAMSQSDQQKVIVDFNRPVKNEPGVMGGMFDIGVESW